MPDLSNGKATDFFFMERSEPEHVVQTVSELVKTRLPRSYRTKPGEIQVLTPMQRGETGVANLNQVLQEAVNPGTDGLRRGGYLFRVRDKVMQLRNNYDKEVFNGDIGVVEAVDLEDRALDVSFDERSVRYDVTELDELVLAYATTIHKSQGSEYPIVVMPVLMSHYVMLQRNLIYIGITRAKKALVLVGTKGHSKLDSARDAANGIDKKEQKGVAWIAKTAKANQDGTATTKACDNHTGRVGEACQRELRPIQEVTTETSGARRWRQPV